MSLALSKVISFATNDSTYRSLLVQDVVSTRDMDRYIMNYIIALLSQPNLWSFHIISKPNKRRKEPMQLRYCASERSQSPVRHPAMKIHRHVRMPFEWAFCCWTLRKYLLEMSGIQWSSISDTWTTEPYWTPLGATIHVVSFLACCTGILRRYVQWETCLYRLPIKPYIRVFISLQSAATTRNTLPTPW